MIKSRADGISFTVIYIQSTNSQGAQNCFKELQSLFRVGTAYKKLSTIRKLMVHIFQQRHSGDIVPNIVIVTSSLCLWVLLVHFINEYLLLLQTNYFFYYISSNTVCFYVFIYREVYCLSNSCSIKTSLLMFDKEWIASFLVKFFCKFRKSFALKIFDRPISPFSDLYVVNSGSGLI